MVRETPRSPELPAALRACKSSRCRTQCARSYWLLAAAMFVAGCAPDAFRPSPGYDAFLRVISQECFPRSIGGQQISRLVTHGSPPFLNATSRLYHGQIDGGTYRNLITAFSDNSRQTNDAIDCIIGNLPPAQPSAPLTNQ